MDDAYAEIWYAGERATDPAVQALLARIGDPGALAGWAKPTDFRRFQGLMPLLAKLVAAGEDSEANLALLFGPHRFRVDDALRQARMYQGAQPGSPAHTMMSRYTKMTQKELRSPLRCDVCGNEGDKKTIKQCSACKRAHYCSAECQHDDWTLHRPRCLKFRGKPVPPDVQAAADALQRKRDREQKQAHELSKAEVTKKEMDGFIPGATFSHDCDGQRRSRDLPWCGENMIEDLGRALHLDVERCNFIIPPPGVGTANRASFFRCKETKKCLLICWTRLFADRGDGTHNGTAIDEIYVRTGPSDMFKGQKFRKIEVPRPFTLEALNGLLVGLKTAD